MNAFTTPEGAKPVRIMDAATTSTTTPEKPELLNLECIMGDLSIVAVFLESLEHFINDARAVVRGGGGQDIILREINSIDIMAGEIKHRVGGMQQGFDEFIEAADAKQLWAERKSA